MATTKAYSVVRAFAARTKDGDQIWVSRDRQHELADLLPPAVLKEHVEAGNLTAYDAEQGNPAESALAEPAADADDGFVRPTTAPARAPRRK